MRYPVVVAITGASGTVYAQRLLQRALDHFETIGLTISRHAFRVMQEELELEATPADFRPEMLLPGTKLAPLTTAVIVGLSPPPPPLDPELSVKVDV